MRVGKYWAGWIGSSLFLLTMAGCGIPSTPPPQDQEITPQSILAAWKELPKAGAQSMDIQTATQLTQQLAMSGPDALMLLVDVIADPKEDAVTKVLADICLTPHINEKFMPRLLALTESDQEITTRMCAVNLVANISAPPVFEKLRTLMDDPERRIRLGATAALIKGGDPQALARLDGLWQDPASTSREREHIVLSIPETEAAKHLSIFKEAVVNPELSPSVHKQAVTFLGRYGDASAVESLENCSTKDPDQEVRTLAQGALAALKSRIEAPAPPESVSQPPAPAASEAQQ